MLLLWFLLITCWWYWRNWKYLVTYWRVGSRFPLLPVLGHIYLLGTREQTLQRLFRSGEHAIRNGGLSSGWILNRFYIVMADAMDVEYILKNHLEKCDVTTIFRDFTRSSLLFASVNEWRRHRKIVSPFLSNKNVIKFEPVFAEGSQSLAQRLRPLVGKEPFSIWEHFSDYTVKATCDTILGIELKSHSEVEYLRKVLNSIMDVAALFSVLTIFNVAWLMKKTRFYGTFLRCDKFVKSCVDKALEKHENDALRNNESDTSTQDEESVSSLLHIFTRLKKQREIDHSLLHDESLGLLIASSDTTAITASIVAVVLAKKPDVQEKIYLELQEVFGDAERPVTVEDLPRLKYMEAAIKETMRLYPPVAYISRKVLLDTTLPSGLAVPKGTNFHVSIYALNRNPKYWGADAEQFRPERFLDGSVSEQTTFFGFSYGPRGCPGSLYAMMSMKTVLATLLRQYRLLPAAAGDAPLRLLFGVTLKAADDFQVRIEMRK